MKNSKITIGTLCVLLALAVQGFGQTQFQVTFKGTCLATNGSGAIVSTKLDNKALIQDAVTATGATNSSGLTVVYVQNASTDPSVPGDYIEVVNSSNGVPVFTNLQFMYGGSSFPPALISADQTEVAIGAGVIPQPLAGSGDALGGATIHERILTKKTLITGSFNYTTLRSPAATFNDIEEFCSGTFNVGKPFVPK